MDNVLDYIEKYKWAIILTAFLHIAGFFYVNFETIEQPFRMPDPAVEMMLPLDDIEFDPEIMEQLKLNEQKQVSEEVYNVSADANDTREESYEDFSTQELDAQVENDARNLEQQYFDEWAATHDNSDGGSSSSNPDVDKSDPNKNQNNINRDNIATGGDKAFAGEVMVSYDLQSRKAHSLPRPGYTCNSSGTIVVDVKVDKAGSVKSATYNSGLSTSSSECMISKAIRYAKKSRFNFSGSAPGSQSGTITYKFVSK